jgi:hypothetical protein
MNDQLINIQAKNSMFSDPFLAASEEHSPSGGADSYDKGIYV